MVFFLSAALPNGSTAALTGAVTLQDLLNRTRLLVGEPADGPAGALSPSDGSAPVVSADAALIVYLNEARAEFVKTCWPVWTYGQASVAAGQTRVPFSALVTPDRSVLWAVGANGVDFSGAPLRRGTRHYADTYYPSRPSDPPGPPVVWTDQGGQGIGLAPRPPAPGVLTVSGLAVPPPLALPTDTLPWMEADSVWVLCEYAAAKLCESSPDHAALGPQAPVHWQRWQEGVAARRAELSNTERALMLTFDDGAAVSDGGGQPQVMSTR